MKLPKHDEKRIVLERQYFSVEFDIEVLHQTSFGRWFYNVDILYMGMPLCAFRKDQFFYTPFDSTEIRTVKLTTFKYINSVENFGKIYGMKKSRVGEIEIVAELSEFMVTVHRSNSGNNVPVKHSFHNLSPLSGNIPS